MQGSSKASKNSMTELLFSSKLVATIDVLTSDLMFSGNFLMFDASSTNLMLAQLLFFTFPFLQDESKFFKVSFIKLSPSCVLGYRSKLKKFPLLHLCIENNILRYDTSLFLMQ